MTDPPTLDCPPPRLTPLAALLLALVLSGVWCLGVGGFWIVTMILALIA